jgi:putative toxin-antitoxin system antitoxin component (TIGR02293 family)
MELHEKTRLGLPYVAFDSVRSVLRLTHREAARAIGVPERTLARRKKEKKFNALESDRLLRMARVGALAVEILGNEDNAAQWLKKANYALGARP